MLDIDVERPPDKRQPPEPHIKIIAGHLERNWAVALGAVYLIGFITVIQYEAQFGIVPLSPLKPRIISAGLLFAALAAATSLAALTSFGLLSLENEELPLHGSSEKWRSRGD
jgi:hypothetical protein